MKIWIECRAQPQKIFVIETFLEALKLHVACIFRTKIKHQTKIIFKNMYANLMHRCKLGFVQGMWHGEIGRAYIYQESEG